MSLNLAAPSKWSIPTPGGELVVKRLALAFRAANANPAYICTTNQDLDFMQRFLSGVLGRAFCQNAPLASWLAVSWQSPRPQMAEPCGSCPNCQKWLAGEHPEIWRLGAQEAEVIGIEQVRELAPKLAWQPVLAPFKAVIITQADKMSLAAQNAFLKLLEEPPSKTYFFLLTKQPRVLLKTIRSRAPRLDLPGGRLPLSTAWHILGRQGLKPLAAQFMAALGYGDLVAEVASDSNTGQAAPGESAGSAGERLNLAAEVAASLGAFLAGLGSKQRAVLGDAKVAEAELKPSGSLALWPLLNELVSNEHKLAFAEGFITLICRDRLALAYGAPEEQLYLQELTNELKCLKLPGIFKALELLSLSKQYKNFHLHKLLLLEQLLFALSM